MSALSNLRCLGEKIAAQYIKFGQIDEKHSHQNKTKTKTKPKKKKKE